MASPHDQHATQHLSELADKIVARACTKASHSWEFGAASEALLELYNPELSVFGPDPFPDGVLPLIKLHEVKALQFVRPFIQIASPILIDGDGSSGDPAALGVFAQMIGESEGELILACQRQKEVLLASPRWVNGAISHRSEYPAVWADFVFMAPPFMAYHAVATKDLDLMLDAVNQCFLYQEVLSAHSSEPGFAGAWMHIIAPELEDRGSWATGNAWAAGGILRVLATLMKWATTKNRQEERTGLATILVEMIEAFQTSSKRSDTGLVTKFLNDNAWFSDAGSTAMMVAVVYRLSLLLPAFVSSDLLQFAHDKFDEVLRHVALGDGNVAPTPQSGLPGWKVNEAKPEGSSQGHSFVVMMLSAKRDWSRNGGVHEAVD